MKTHFALRTILITCGTAGLLSAVAGTLEPGFQSLFNGKDLAGWAGNPALWSVKDGAITGVTTENTKLTHNTFLVYTNSEVADFELRLSFKLVGGNSGIQYRSKILTNGAFGPIVGGYQADFDAGNKFSGIIYEEKGRGIICQRGKKVVLKEGAPKTKIEEVGVLGSSEEIGAKIKAGEWNEYVIIAKGNHLQQFINGAATADLTDEQPSKAAANGILALQIHQGPPMTVQFKDIRIKKL